MSRVRTPLPAPISHLFQVYYIKSSPAGLYSVRAKVRTDAKSGPSDTPVCLGLIFGEDSRVSLSCRVGECRFVFEAPDRSNGQTTKRLSPLPLRSWRSGFQSQRNRNRG